MGGAGDGIVTGAYTYNARDWVTGLDYAGAFRSTLTYDPAGNITRQVYRRGSAAAKPEEYAYDDLYRITGFDLAGGDSRDYAYDRNGNITSLMTGTSTLTYNYSDASTTQQAGQHHGHGRADIRLQPERMDDAKRHRYGELRLPRAYHRIRQRKLPHGSRQTAREEDRRDRRHLLPERCRWRCPGRIRRAEPVGKVHLRRQQAHCQGCQQRSSARYYLADHLGSTRALVDEEGAVTATYDYWPYGEILATSGAESTHFRFTGHERDDEAGLDYMLERSYAFDIGRFTRPDPMADEYPGISPYAYANNNPLKFVDPDGRAAETFWDVVNIGIGAASLAQNIREGSYGWAALDAVGLVVDLAATITPGVPGGAGTLIKVLRGARSADQGADAADAARSAMQRGRASENRVLNDLELPKNTQKVSTSKGSSIPDALTDTKSIEIKDTKRVSFTRQLEILAEAAQESGRKSVLITGAKTHVSKNTREKFDVIRRKDLGPQ